VHTFAKALLLTGLTVGACATGGCASRPTAPPAPVAAAPVVTPTSVAGDLTPVFTMTGSFDIFSDSASTAGLKDGQPCQTAGPDGKPIGSSTVTRVYDQQGHQLAWGYLTQGTFDQQFAACVYPISIQDVPDGLPGYGVEVAQFGVKQINSTQAHGNVFLSEGR
jgi:hypothetical protein